MTDDDLFDMLDLDAPLPDDESPAECASLPMPAASRHKNAVVLDDWTRRRGEEVWGAERFPASRLDHAAAADCFAMAFDPHPVLQPCVDQHREEFLKALAETPDYQALHDVTQLDDFASELAAIHFAEQLAQHKAERQKAHKDPAGKTDDDLAATLAAGKAAAAAAAEVAEYSDACEATGMGKGESGERRDPRAVAEAYKRIRNNPTLRRICEHAGRFRRVAQSKQRMKTTHGFDDMVGVEPGGDLGRLLPHEMAKLGVEELELDTLRRIVERQALCREYAGVEPAGKGPIIITLDESGSMHSKIDAAKGLALSLAWIAKQQKRWCALVAYSGDSGERVLALPPGKWNEGEVNTWLLDFIGGGSDIDVPVRELPRMYADLKPAPGITDVVMITDAICHLPADLVERFNTWKRDAKARIISLIIDSRPGDLLKVSDECHTVQGINTDEPAIGRVLGI